MKCPNCKGDASTITKGVIFCDKCQEFFQQNKEKVFEVVKDKKKLCEELNGRLATFVKPIKAVLDKFREPEEQEEEFFF